MINLKVTKGAKSQSLVFTQTITHPETRFLGGTDYTVNHNLGMLITDFTITFIWASNPTVIYAKDTYFTDVFGNRYSGLGFTNNANLNQITVSLYTLLGITIGTPLEVTFNLYSDGRQASSI